MSSARFEVEVTPESALDFARLSGDWNPLHTDDAHAQATPYRRRVLHGAFSAGLVSRMAGMFLPGTDCLLHGMRLRFLAPIIPPASLSVDGQIVSDSGSTGRVDVVISDRNSGVRYVDASYEFGRHESGHLSETKPARVAPGVATGEPVILVTGGSGGLGSAVMAAVGPQAIGLSRVTSESCVQVASLESQSDLAAAIPPVMRITSPAVITYPTWALLATRPCTPSVPLTRALRVVPSWSWTSSWRPPQFLTTRASWEALWVMYSDRSV
jgi:acyl dehydratase